MSSSPVHGRRTARVAVSLLLASLAVTAGCGDDSNDDGGSTTTVEYAGVFGSSANAGRLAFGTATAVVRDGFAGLAVTNLSGTMDFISGASVALTGTLDGVALSLTGSGYTFTGTQNGNVISGTFTGPGGETGSFSATLVPDGVAITTMCGSYDGSDSGVFSLNIAPDRSGGVIIVPDDGSPGMTGKARAKANSSDQVEVLPDALPSFVVATGTVNGTFNAITGSWDDGQGNSGTFQGSVDACIPVP